MVRQQLCNSENGQGVSVAFLHLEEVFPVIFPVSQGRKIFFGGQTEISVLVVAFTKGFLSIG